MPDAIKLLTTDHDTVRGLFERWRTAQEAGDTSAMDDLQGQIFSELENHTRIEEEIFYPRVRELGVEDITETVREGLQEHHVVKLLMREIEQLVDHDVLEAKMKVLIENVEHHAGEEEDELFPEIREHLGEEKLQELGDELAAAK